MITQINQTTKHQEFFQFSMLTNLKTQDFPYSILFRYKNKNIFIIK